MNNFWIQNNKRNYRQIIKLYVENAHISNHITKINNL